MSANSTITLEWADDTYQFRLGLRELAELQEKCDAGPHWLAVRLENGQYFARDVYETIRLGLIGGGTDPVKAKKLADRYWEPLRPNAIVAYRILVAVIEGVQDDEIPKEPAVEETEPQTLSPEESSASPPSTSGE